MTTNADCSAILQVIQPSARSSPGGVFGNTASSTTAPVAAMTSANEWVAAWVSTPMTNVYCSATMGMRSTLPQVCG